MQNSAAHKLILFFSKGLMLAISLILLVLCFLASTQYPIFSFFLIVFIGLSGILSFSLLIDYRKIQQFDWSNESKEAEIPIKETDDLTLKVCKRYVNKATYEQIKQEFSLSSNEQITRIIRKRLKDTM